MMIKSIELRNFRQFQTFRISCKSVNILVGPNNAGKSTSLDALRFLVDVFRHSRTRRPLLSNSPSGRVCASYEIAHTYFGPAIANANRNYDEADAQILIEHENGAKMRILIHPERPVRAFLETEAAPPRTGVAFRSAFPIDVVVVPTLGPLDENETWVNEDTVQRNRYTRLANRSFRNIIMRMSNLEFQQFAELSQSSWPDIILHKPRMVNYLDKRIEMTYEENRIPREIFWSGFGFQVWMQMMYQFMRSKEDSILVLDEPDIYLHPDSQKRLLKLVKNRFSQVFLATHSTEIINEAEPGDILLVAKNSGSAQRISTEDGYRELFNYIGSSENAEFARIARAKRIVFFEGKDRKIIRRFSGKIDHTDLLENPDTAFFQSGGFAQWNRILNVNWALENMFQIDAKIVAIFDRDYLCDDEVSNFLDRMNDERMKTFVLDRKEIENYAIEYMPVCRTIMKRVASRGIDISEGTAREIVDNVIFAMKGDVQARKLAHYLAYKKKHSPAVDDVTHLAEGGTDFEARWADPQERIKMIPGKQFFSDLSRKLQDTYGCGITITQVISEMRRGDVSAFISGILQEADRFFAS